MSLVEKRLGDLAVYISGRGFKPADWGTQGLPIVRIANLNNVKAPIDYFGGALADGHAIRDGDILVSWSATLDAFIWNRGPAALNQHIFKVLPRGTVRGDYLFFVLKQAMTRLGSRAHGATMQHVTRPEFESFSVFIEDDPTQQRHIAARLKAQLAEVDTAREASQAQVRETGLLRSRLLRQTFDALSNVPRKLLGEWAATSSGVTPSRDNDAYWNPPEIAWVKTGEIDFSPIVTVKESISRRALAECSLSLLPPNTVLVAITGEGKTRGRSAVLAVEATTNQHSVAVLPNDTWDSDFLQLWLQASYQDLRELSEGRGGSRSALSGGQIKSLAVPAPSKNDQLRIVSGLKSQIAGADAIASAAAAQLAEIERLPQRLLAQAFAGTVA